MKKLLTLLLLTASSLGAAEYLDQITQYNISDERYYRKADLNRNGVVNLEDYVYLAYAIDRCKGMTIYTGQPYYEYDLNDDKKVDMSDYYDVMKPSWGYYTPYDVPWIDVSHYSDSPWYRYFYLNTYNSDNYSTNPDGTHPYWIYKKESWQTSWTPWQIARGTEGPNGIVLDPGTHKFRVVKEWVDQWGVKRSITGPTLTVHVPYDVRKLLKW